MTDGKTIYITYDKNDRDEAIELSKIIDEWIGHECTWLRDFETDAGDLIYDALDRGIENSNWFIILHSKSAAGSEWLNYEVSVQAFRTLENIKFTIIVVQLDTTPFSEHLEVYLRAKYVVDASTDRTNIFYEIADYIEKTDPAVVFPDTFVNRGKELDDFWTSARQNRNIMFIWGWSGIGKTSFVRSKLQEKLNRRPREIKLTAGYSLDRLTRDVISVLRAEPPRGAVSDEELLVRSIDALRKNKRNFLLIDDAEQGLDTGNSLQDYLERFLNAFSEAELDTYIVLATTRNPDIPNSIVRRTDVFRLGLLGDDHITEMLENLTVGYDSRDTYIKMAEFKELVQSIDGYPLAALFIAIALRTKSPKELLLEHEQKKLQLKAARDILRTITKTTLSRLQLDILYALTIAGEPITFSDVRGVKRIAKHKASETQLARSDLINWNLIEVNFDLETLTEYMSVHRFIAASFTEEIRREEGLYEDIATSLGIFAFNKTMEYYERLQIAYSDGLHSVSNDVEKLLREVYRYAVMAYRLLESVSRYDLSRKIPAEFKVKGILREMVFFYYQEKRDYEKALEYAEKWLALVPNDHRVKLFQARCYRNFRDIISLEKAGKAIDELERMMSKRQPRAEIWRERALIADFSGDEAGAEEFFRKGIETDTNATYTESYTGLAMIYLRQADRLTEGSNERIEKAKKALGLLEYAREHDRLDKRDNFDLFHLGTYVEALIENGQEEQAFPLLFDALERRPYDSKLLYRIGEIYRKKNQFELAERYALQAKEQGETKAAMTLANIEYSRALEQPLSSESRRAIIEKGLALLDEFEPEYGSGHEVKATVRIKMYRALQEFDKAIEVSTTIPTKYRSSFMVMEECLTLRDKAFYLEHRGQYAEALDVVRQALETTKAIDSEKMTDIGQTVSDLLACEQRLISFAGD